MKKKQLFIRIGLLIAVIIIIAGFAGYKMYNKPHRSVDDESAITTIATQLAAEYEADEAGSNKKYLDKAIQVSGIVSDISTNQQHKTVLILKGSDMSSVQCTLLENTTPVKKGDNVTVKGFCTGYLTDVVLNQCKIVPLK